MKLRTAALGTTFVVISFFVLPGLFARLNRALALPQWETSFGDVAGWILIAMGIGVASHCSHLFRRLGLGTPVPVEPPTQLVATGLYSYSRNPIYVADVEILLGIFLVRGDVLLLLYVVLFAGAIHAWIVRREEPELRDRFGEEYVEYTQRVPRWLWDRRLNREAGRDA
jgi:protein-S-isoprenylcysteine O-methyltransferase Ste14